VTPESLKTQQAAYVAALDAKRIFQERHSAILEAKKEVDKQLREAENALRASIAQYALVNNAIHPFNPAKDAQIEWPEGMTVNTRNIVEYDKDTVDTWVRQYAPYLLVVNWDAYEYMVQAHAANPRASVQPGIKPPGTPVRAILPVLSEKQPKPEPKADPTPNPQPETASEPAGGA
jgi:hypothetical protein